MKGNARHNKLGKKISALTEFENIGGNLGFWEFFKKYFESNKIPPCITIPKSTCDRIHADLQHLIYWLKNVGLNASKEQLLVMLGNMELMFKDANPAEYLYKDKTGKITIAPFFYYPFPLNLKLKERVITQGGRPRDNLELYSLLPWLVIYTAFISKTCTPKWELIRRLIDEEFGVKYADIKRWWYENVKTLRRNPRGQRERLVSFSAESYLEWIVESALFRWNDQGKAVLNKEVKKYCNLVVKLCPFLKKDAKKWVHRWISVLEHNRRWMRRTTTK